MRRKNQQGITLIALIISIIVLLILAGVSIMTLAGDNGLLTRTAKLKNIVGESETIENIKLAYQNALIEKKISGNEDRVIEEMTKDLEKIYGEVKITKDGSVYKVEIDTKRYKIDENGNVTLSRGLKIEPSTLALEISTNGGNVTKTPQILSVSLIDIEGTVTWSVSKGTGVVSLSSTTGSSIQVTPETAGTATITASAESGTYVDSCSVTVENRTAVSYIGDMEEQTVARNETITLTLPNSLDQSIEAEDIYWGGSTSGILEVAGDGRSASYKPSQKGYEYIEVDINGTRYTSFPVHVIVPVESISFSQEEYQFYVDGTECYFDFIVEPWDADLPDLHWECDWSGNFGYGGFAGNLSPHDSNSYGSLSVGTSSNDGTYRIRIYESGADANVLCDEAKVTFEWKLYDSFSLSCGSDVEMIVGDNLDVSVSYDPLNANVDDLEFDYDNSVVRISGVGDAFGISAVGVGNCTINIRNRHYPSWSEHIDVTVKSIGYEVELSEENLRISPNSSYNISISYSPSDAQPNFYWSERDNNNSIAEIINGNDDNSWTVNAYMAGSTEFYLYDSNDPSTRLATIYVTVE